MKKALLSAILIVALSINSFAGEPPEAILRSLPAQIKTYTAGDIVTYKDKRLGASVGYNDPARVAVTVFLYDLGVEEIGEGIDAEVIRSSKNMAIADIRKAEGMGYYSNVSIVSDTVKTWKLKDGRQLKLLSVSLTYLMNNPYTGESSAVVSDLYLAGLKGLICKVRISRPAGLGKEDEGGITEMLKELFFHLKR